MALWSLEGAIRQVAPDARPLAFTRLDIAWQWRESDPRMVLGSLGYLRHPRVRRATVLYAGESVHWPGEDLHVRVYDAHKEQSGRSGDVLRLEAQMRGDLARLSPLKPTISGLYAQLRSVVAPLRGSVPVTVCAPGVAELLALCSAQNICYPGTQIPVLDWFLQAQTKTTRWRLLRALKDCRLRSQLWSWDDVLPVCPPNPAEWVHLEAA
jgi:hypothetical protein